MRRTGNYVGSFALKARKKTKTKQQKPSSFVKHTAILILTSEPQNQV